MRGRLAGIVGAWLLCASLPGCSARSLAVSSLSDTLARSAATYATDDDPELVGQAFPSHLKTIEGLLNEAPSHAGLLSAAASGFTQYAFGFVQQDADRLEATDVSAATGLRERAVKLYQRARDYGFRGLEVSHPGFRKGLREDPGQTLRPLRKRDVPLLYWTALSWAAAMALAKSDSSLSADQDLTATLMTRALELDEPFALGALHDFFIVQEGSRSSVGGSRAKARDHLKRALDLAQGRRAWPFVFFAESVSLAAQDRKEFEGMLREALALDPGRDPGQRLSNLLAQRRARWLLARADEFFVE